MQSGNTERYLAHLSLPGFGIEKQELLSKAKVLVVGAGGLGCPVLQYLAAAGCGTIGIVDDDVVSISNLQRQVLYQTGHAGKSKTANAAAALRALNPTITINEHNQRLIPDTVRPLFSAYNVIVDGSDNFATKYLINDACVTLQKPWIFAAVTQFTGQLSVCNWQGSDGKRGPTYRCIFPEPPDSFDSPPCSEAGVLGVIPGVIGCLQATEVIKIVTGLSGVLSGTLLLYNGLKVEFQKLTVSRQEHIVAATKILDSYESVCSTSEVSKRKLSTMGSASIVKDVTPKDLKVRLDNGDSVLLIDIREEHERHICNIGGTHIPMNSILERQQEIPRDKPVVIYCRSGGRSQQVVEALQQEFKFTNLLNLAGGVLRWSDEVDSSVQKY